jgi:hypothetical protein
VARARQRLDQPAPDESGCAGNEHVLPARQRSHKIGGIPANEPVGASRREKVAQPKDHHSRGGERRKHARQAVIDRNQCARLVGPAPQDRSEQGKNGAVIDGQQRVGDALARRQLAAQVFFDEIHERDEDFRRQHGNQEHRPKTVRLEPAEQKKEHRVGEIARAMKRKLVALRGPPCNALGHFVMIDDVEQTHRKVGGDQGPQHRGRHGAISRNTAI